MHRAFSGCNRIGVTRTDAKTMAAIVQKDTALPCVKAATEAAKQRIDEGDRVPVAVNHRQIHRVRMFNLRPRSCGQSHVQADRPPDPFLLPLGQEIRRFHRMVLGIAEIGIPEPVGGLRDLCQKMDAVGLVVAGT